MKCSISRRFLGLRRRPRWGSLRHSPDPLVVSGFLPSAIAASRLRHLHFPYFSISVPQSYIQIYASDHPPSSASGSSIHHTVGFPVELSLTSSRTVTPIHLIVHIQILRLYTNTLKSQWK